VDETQRPSTRAASPAAALTVRRGRLASADLLSYLVDLQCTNRGLRFSTAKESARAHCSWACGLRRLSAGQSAGHRQRSDT
jgi:hypothetical protein